MDCSLVTMYATLTFSVRPLFQPPGQLDINRQRTGAGGIDGSRLGAWRMGEALRQIRVAELIL